METILETTPITREVAVEFLKTVKAQCDRLTKDSKHGKERITFRFHSDLGNTLMYTEVANGEERGRVIVGYGSNNRPKIISSYYITQRVLDVLSKLPMPVKRPKQKLPKPKKRKPLQRHIPDPQV